MRPRFRTATQGDIVRLRFETIFLLLVWFAVILLIVFYPHFVSR